MVDQYMGQFLFFYQTWICVYDVTEFHAQAFRLHLDEKLRWHVFILFMASCVF